MFQRMIFAAFVSSSLLLLLTAVGCFHTTYGPAIGMPPIPVPVTPFFQDDLEDQAWEKERYDTVTHPWPDHRRWPGGGA